MKYDNYNSCKESAVQLYNSPRLCIAETNGFSEYWTIVYLYMLFYGRGVQRVQKWKLEDIMLIAASRQSHKQYYVGTPILTLIHGVQNGPRCSSVLDANERSLWGQGSTWFSRVYWDDKGRGWGKRVIENIAYVLRSSAVCKGIPTNGILGLLDIRSWDMSFVGVTRIFII